MCSDLFYTIYEHFFQLDQRYYSIPTISLATQCHFHLSPTCLQFFQGEQGLAPERVSSVTSVKVKKKSFFAAMIEIGNHMLAAEC